MENDEPEIRICRECNRMYESYNKQLTCSTCSLIEKRKLIEVRNYINNNKETDFCEIVRVCNVREELVKEWVRDELIVFQEESNVDIKCEKCGMNIYTGRYCKLCKIKIIDELEAAYIEIEEKKSISKKVKTQGRDRFIR